MKVFYKMKPALLLMAAMLSFGTAMAETGSETEADQQNGNKNVTAEGVSFTIDGGFIAGTGSLQKPPMTSKGLKFRTGTSGGTLTFTVRPNYTITRLYMAGVGNYARKDESIDRFIDVTKVEVDGVEVPFTGGQFPDKNSDVAAELFVENIAATETITLYFDNSNAEGTQVNASWAIDWSRPDATQPTITVTPTDLALLVGETYKVSAHVDPANFTTHWESGLPEVATVSEDGVVTAVSTGLCTIDNVWDEDASVFGSMQLMVTEFDPADYNLVKEYDFTQMGDVTLTIGSEPAGLIWNEGNKKTNNVFFLTNEGLEDIAVQAVLSGGKGWSIVDGQGLVLASGAGRCAAVKAKAGQYVEIFYTGDGFYTGSKNDPVRPDDGAEKTAYSQAIGHALYLMEEDGLLGFELIKGNAVTKIAVYDFDLNFEPDEMELDFNKLVEAGIATTDGTSYYAMVGAPYNLDFTGVEGIKAYVGTKNRNNYGEVESVTLMSVAEVPEGTPVLLKADALASYTVPVVDEVDELDVTNDFVVADEDQDLYAMVKTAMGEFVSGPARLALGTVITGIDWDTYEYTYGEAFGFFPYDAPVAAETDFIPAGIAYLNLEDGEWDTYGVGYVKLIFADAEAYTDIASLEALPITDGTPATLQFAQPTIVSWTNGDYALVEDNTAGLLMQVPEGVSVEAGNQLKGSFTGNYVNLLFPQLLVSGFSQAESIEVVAGGEAPQPKALSSFAEAFEEGNVMRLVKLSGLKLKFVDEDGYSDYYLSDDNGTEVYVNDAFNVAESAFSAGGDGATVTEIIGFAFIVDDDSPFLSFDYDKYEFMPLEVKDVTTGISDVQRSTFNVQPIYNMQGVRVAAPKKGVFIQNGRKVVVK